MNCEITTRLIHFLNEIELPNEFGDVPDGVSVPGLRLSKGKVQIDPNHLTYPGDILYMAGLLATASPSERANLVCIKKPDPAHETAAMAWAYAASYYLAIDPTIVFHEGGYQQDGERIIVQFQAPNPFGVPLLQWFRMCETFPTMNTWIRTVEDPTQLSQTEEKQQLTNNN